MSSTSMSSMEKDPEVKMEEEGKEEPMEVEEVVKGEEKDQGQEEGEEKKETEKEEKAASEEDPLVVEVTDPDSFPFDLFSAPEPVFRHVVASADSGVREGMVVEVPLKEEKEFWLAKIEQVKKGTIKTLSKGFLISHLFAGLRSPPQAVPRG